MSEKDNKQPPKVKEVKDKPVDNVIRFPVEKVRHKMRLKKLAGKMGENKKSTLFLSLLSIMVMSAYLLQNQQENNRYVASSIDNRDLQKETVLNNTLQDSNIRNPASYGRRPTSEERLREQDLNRAYQFKYDEAGAVIDVTYVRPTDEEETKLEPVYLKPDDLPDFLLRNRDVFATDFDEVSLEGATYVLIKNGNPVGKAYFKFDEAGKLRGVSIKVQVF